MNQLGLARIVFSIYRASRLPALATTLLANKLHRSDGVRIRAITLSFGLDISQAYAQAQCTCPAGSLDIPAATAHCNCTLLRTEYRSARGACFPLRPSRSIPVPELRKNVTQSTRPVSASTDHAATCARNGRVVAHAGQPLERNDRI